MRKSVMVILFAMFSTTAHAQLTNCDWTGYGYSCWTNGPSYPRQSPLSAFLKGYLEGRMWRKRMEQLELQNELLRRRLNGGQ